MLGGAVHPQDGGLAINKERFTSEGDTQDSVFGSLVRNDHRGDYFRMFYNVAEIQFLADGVLILGVCGCAHIIKAWQVRVIASRSSFCLSNFIDKIHKGDSGVVLRSESPLLCLIAFSKQRRLTSSKTVCLSLLGGYLFRKGFFDPNDQSDNLMVSRPFVWLDKFRVQFFFPQEVEHKLSFVLT
jgi:hypothetical protein